MKEKKHKLLIVSTSRTTAPNKLLHSDVCAPMEVASLRGARYFLPIKNDLSYFRIVYFLIMKSKAKERNRACIVTSKITISKQ